MIHLFLMIGFLCAALPFSAPCRAGEISDFLRQTERSFARAPSTFSPAQRLRVFAGLDFAVFAHLQSKRDAPLTWDADDRHRFTTHLMCYAPVLIGGRFLRQTNHKDEALIQTAADAERESWRAFDELLSTDAKMDLAKAYPGMMKAVLTERPRVLRAAVMSHYTAHDLSFPKTVEAFGQTRTVLALTHMSFAAYLTKLRVAGGQRLAEDFAAAQAFINLARYLKIDATKAFCEARLNQ